jgi:hypothetical protein
MRPTQITSVYFEGAFSDFLSSQETTAQELRSELVGRIKKDEGLVAIVAGAHPRVLLLKSSLDPALKGQKAGDQ